MAKKVEKKEEKKGFTPKEKLSHYAAVANGSKPVKESEKHSAAQQRAYARGQTDARRELNMSFMLGKHSPLTDEEKAALKARNKARREEFKKNKGKGKGGNVGDNQPTAEELAEMFDELNRGKL